MNKYKTSKVEVPSKSKNNVEDVKINSINDNQEFNKPTNVVKTNSNILDLFDLVGEKSNEPKSTLNQIQVSKPSTNKDLFSSNFDIFGTSSVSENKISNENNNFNLFEPIDNSQKVNSKEINIVTKSNNNDPFENLFGLGETTTKPPSSNLGFDDITFDKEFKSNQNNFNQILPNSVIKDTNLNTKIKPNQLGGYDPFNELITETKKEPVSANVNFQNVFSDSWFPNSKLLIVEVFALIVRACPRERLEQYYDQIMGKWY